MGLISRDHVNCGKHDKRTVCDKCERVWIEDPRGVDYGPHIEEGGLCMACGEYPDCDRPHYHEGDHRILMHSFKDARMGYRLPLRTALLHAPYRIPWYQLQKKRVEVNGEFFQCVGIKTYRSPRFTERSLLQGDLVMLLLDSDTCSSSDRGSAHAVGNGEGGDRNPGGAPKERQ